jgi:FAD dependent oxidoreductase TIGR03364
MSNKTAIVVGAGIVGLATARALALKGYSVTVIERTNKAVGASIRNFGMLWPIGQPDGKLYDRAIRSRNIWKEIADTTGIWYEEAGSLHLAHHADEWEVLQELQEKFSSSGRPVQLLDKDTIDEKFNYVNTNGLLGGLFSNTEMIIDPREGIAKVPEYLNELHQVQFIWGKAVTIVDPGIVWVEGEILHSDIICICSGADFETLFPAEFAALDITKCKLQMMRFSENTGTRINTSLCGGLSLIHYNSFKAAPSLEKLKKRYENEMKPYLDYGIHVMVSQNGPGEFTVGDSHEYANTFDPFDKAFINEMIMDYLKTFAICNNWQLIQSWHGIYPKMTNGDTDVFLNPLPGVYIINGLGGAGMTMSFGFAEECINIMT